MSRNSSSVGREAANVGHQGLHTKGIPGDTDRLLNTLR